MKKEKHFAQQKIWTDKHTLDLRPEDKGSENEKKYNNSGINCDKEKTITRKEEPKQKSDKN
jgi:hypothetical protein